MPFWFKVVILHILKSYYFDWTWFSLTISDPLQIYVIFYKYFGFLHRMTLNAYLLNKKYRSFNTNIEETTIKNIQYKKILFKLILKKVLYLYFLKRISFWKFNVCILIILAIYHSFYLESQHNCTLSYIVYLFVWKLLCSACW